MEEKRKIYSVAELNRTARFTLENGIGEVWVEGEISRLTRQASGHWYFTLKDEAAAVSCAMFKQNNAVVIFAPKDGLKVRVLGQASLYEPRGSYQLLIRKMEEAGKGSLQEQFEKLKARLAAEGLFDASRKKPLPLLPQKIGVVTSPTGAAIRDIINVLTRRFPNLGILLAPVTVQGEGSAQKIAAAINYLNTYNEKAGQASSLSKTDEIHYFAPFLPLDIDERHLPHWEQEGVIYFATFRLTDSLPKLKLEHWKNERELWLASNQKPYSGEKLAEYRELFSERINQWLDAGSGFCLLAKKQNAEVVKNALQHFDGERYRLRSYVIMANHVHVLVSPRSGCKLTDILHSWKSFTANEINRLSGNNGSVWQDESYDHIVRSSEELNFYTRYIQKNVEQSNGTALARIDRLEACPTIERPIDILIVGRGGGSIEDLWAFNEEVVARAIAASKIPVISAVGHEIDFTISDFVADVRAPTPSAAAELAVPVKAELETQIARLSARLGGSLQNQVHILRERIPGFRQTMLHALTDYLRQRQQKVDETGRTLAECLKNAVLVQKQRLPNLQQKMTHRLESAVAERKQNLRRIEVQLRALSPLAILNRGYSLTQTATGEVVRDTAQLKKGDLLKTRFAKGTVLAEVKEKES
ncbi:MAG: exodeoxyribonuclease VII large subunit [Kiritimatiellales bacterium]|jgi:exodeoxyribonuclease VII large subunit